MANRPVWSFCIRSLLCVLVPFTSMSPWYDQEAGAKFPTRQNFELPDEKKIISAFSLFAHKDKYRSSFGIPVASTLGKAWHLCTYLCKVVQAHVAGVIQGSRAEPAQARSSSDKGQTETQKQKMKKKCCGEDYVAHIYTRKLPSVS